MATTTTTVATITMVSLFGIRRRVAGRTLCQSKVPTETMIITATSAAIGMLRHHVAEADDQDEQEQAGEERRDPGASARGLHVDHRLADHRAAAHAAEEAR